MLKIMLKLISFHIQAHFNSFLQILEYFSQSVDVDGLNLLAYSVFEFFDLRGVFLYTFPFNRSQRKKSAGVRSASPCLKLFNQFLDATLRWCTSFTKFRSKYRLARFKLTCLQVFTNEKPALFDSIRRQ